MHLNTKLNFLHLSTALTLFIGEATIGSKYSIASSSQADTLVCYMRKEDGSVIDLSNFCGKSGRNATTITVPIQQLLETKQCEGCNLSGANLSSYNLIGANLSNANLSNADMFGANLSNVNISNANLSGARMPDGTIHK